MFPKTVTRQQHQQRQQQLHNNITINANDDDLNNSNNNNEEEDGGLETHLRLEPQVSFFYLLFFLFTLLIYLQIDDPLPPPANATANEYTSVPRSTRKLEGLEPVATSKKKGPNDARRVVWAKGTCFHFSSLFFILTNNF
jgi:hypothetical protein